MIPVVIAVLSVLVVVGAIMWVRPSQTDLRQSRLRQQVLQKRYKVQQRRIPDLSIQGRIDKSERAQIFYRKYRLKDEAQPWCVLRTSGESGIYLPDGWAWEGQSRAEGEWMQWLKTSLSALPESIGALELAPEFFGIAWDERDESQLQQVLDWLERFSASEQLGEA